MLRAAIANERARVDDDPQAVTPYAVIHQAGKASVRHYAAHPRTHRTPIVLVYALIKRPYILDLQPHVSVVRDLTQRGFEVFLIDWLPPTAADSWRGFDAYVNQDLAAAIRAVKAHARTSRVSMMGYCLGALLSVIYAALYPQNVRNLVTLAVPLDMSVRGTPLDYWIEWLDANSVAWVGGAFGNCPAWLLRSVFATMASTYAFASSLGLGPESERDRYARKYPAFRRWLESEVALAGRLFRELALDLFKHNLLARGMMTLDGRAVDLRRVTVSLLNVVAEQDMIVHPKSSLALTDLVGSRDKRNLCFPTGHIGIAVSGEAHARLWPQIADWLAARD